MVALGSGVGAARYARILTQAGFEVTLLAGGQRRMRLFRSVSRVVASSNGYSAPATAESVLALLDREPFQTTVIFDESVLRSLIDLATEGRPMPAGLLPVPADRAHLAAVRGKTGFAAAALAAGLPLPDSRICPDAASARRALAELGSPSILKGDAGSGGQTVRAVHGPGDIEPALEQMRAAFPVVVQRFVRGREGSSALLLADGELQAWTTSYDFQGFPGPHSSRSSRRYQDVPSVRPVLEGIGRLTRFTGLCGVDWIEEEGTRRIFAIEFNPRPVRSMIFNRCPGVDFGRGLLALASGERLLQEPRFDRPFSVRLFPEHVRYCVRQRDLAGLLSWLPGVSRNDFPWDDPALGVATIKSAIGDVLDEAGIRRRR